MHFNPALIRIASGGRAQATHSIQMNMNQIANTIIPLDLSHAIMV